MNNIFFSGKNLSTGCNLFDINSMYKLENYTVQSCDGFSCSFNGKEISDIEKKKIVKQLKGAEVEKRIINCLGDKQNISIFHKNFIWEDDGPYDTIITSFVKKNDNLG